MAYNDQSYGLFQGQVFLQRRLLNGAALGGFVPVGDCDKFEVMVTQKFDDIEESQTGNRLVAAHIPIGTSVATKINLIIVNKANFAASLWGTDTGAVAGGTVTNELANAYNGAMVPLSNPGVSSVVPKLAGLTGTIASIAVTNGGSGYLPSALLALTIAGAGTGATGNAITNAAGVIVGAYVVTPGTAYASPTATVTIPGGGTGAAFQVNMGATALTLGTDYSLDPVSGSLTFLFGSVLVPAVANNFGIAPAGTNAIGITTNYTYASYTGKVEAFTTGQIYYAMRLNGINTASGNSPVIVNVYQSAFNMAKMFDFVMNKHFNLEIDGMSLPDTTRSIPTAAAPYSQFFNIVKG